MDLSVGQTEELSPNFVPFCNRFCTYTFTYIKTHGVSFFLFQIERFVCTWFLLISFSSFLFLFLSLYLSYILLLFSFSLRQSHLWRLSKCENLLFWEMDVIITRLPKYKFTIEVEGENNVINNYINWWLFSLQTGVYTLLGF